MLDRDSNWNAYRYLENLSHVSNNDNSKDDVDDPTNFGDSFLYHIFRCGSRHCEFKNKLILVNNVLSTATNRSHKCIVLSGNDPSSNGFYFSTCNKCKLQYDEKPSQNLNKRFN